MLRRSTLLVCAALVPPSSLAPAVATDPPLGVAPASERSLREWEARFRAIPSADSVRSYMRHLSLRPHHVGSAWGKANAEWMLARFRAWGWEARIDEYVVPFPVPRERRLELVAPTRFVARLEEPALKEDPTSNQKAEQLPPYNAWSPDGDVTAPLVFVNYGLPDDYEQLAQLGISVKGKIVIAKYGRSWRGIKPKVAAEHGAVACLIYSDPADDGYNADDVYPAGASRPELGVQRGSILDMPLYPGDPLTPGTGAVPGATRLARAEAKNLPTIPTLPIGYADAKPLLAALGGRVAPKAWQGGLPITYHVGDDRATARLRVSFEWRTETIRNVIAVMRGAVEPDQWVLRGNHHDAWVNGAEDPVAGLAPMLEEVRALGELARQGWRPRRTLVYAAWDAEEPSLMGSTEWVEHHAEELARKAVLYINTDGNSRGFLDVGGSHHLDRFITEVAREVKDPETGLDVERRMTLRELSQAGSAAARRAIRERKDITLDALGSGSDFTPFLQHLGIPSLNMGFGGEGTGSGGVYHSAFDSFAWFVRFSDTSFVYGRALAQVAGTAAMRAASTEVLPYRFTTLASTAATYVKELKELHAQLAEEAEERNRQLAEGLFRAVNDPLAPLAAPDSLDVPPAINFAPLDNGVAALRAAAERYERARSALWADEGRRLAPADVTALNVALLQVERALLLPDGLPGRPWYRHALYAPGFYTGYGVKTMPAAREALERRQWREAEANSAAIAAALVRAAAAIDRATAAASR